MVLSCSLVRPFIARKAPPGFFLLKARTDAKSVSSWAEPNKTKSPLENKYGLLFRTHLMRVFPGCPSRFHPIFGCHRKLSQKYSHPDNSSIHLSSSTESSRHWKQTISIPGGSEQVPLRKKKRKGALARQIRFAAL